MAENPDDVELLRALAHPVRWGILLRLAAEVRTRAGHRLDSPALIADSDHARVDAYVSLAVIASTIAIAAGAPILDPVIGLGMTVVILRITRDSWRTVHGHAHHD